MIGKCLHRVCHIARKWSHEKKCHWHFVQRKSARSLDFGNLAVRQTKIYVDDVAR